MASKRKPVEDADQDQVNWATNTVAQLRSELTSRGLSHIGRKADLVARLEADNTSESAEVAPVEEGGGYGAEENINWKSYTVPKLKDELGTRGLSLAGKKAELIARLEADYASRSAQVTGVKASRGDDAEDEEEEASDWESYNVAKLKEELTNRGLRVSGKKADLVARLEAHDKGEAIDNAAAPKRAKTSGPIPRFENSHSHQAAAPVPRSASPPNANNNHQAAAPVRGPGSTPNANPAHIPAGQDPDLVDPLAAGIIIHKHMNRETGERRQRDFVPAPDHQFMIKLERIRNERMFMLDRRMGHDRKGHLCQIFDIAGSTGNIYKVTIGRSPNCNCMDARMRGQKCKHINYALIVILKAPAHLQYQLAFLSDELESIFANAPVTRAPDHEHDHDESDESIHNGTRKPIEGDCPICVFEMNVGEELVWCKAACGQNFHKICFEQWRSSRRGGPVTCVYCRAEWQDTSAKKPIPGSLASLKETAPKIGSYRNIGHHPMYHDGDKDHERYGVEEAF